MLEKFDFSSSYQDCGDDALSTSQRYHFYEQGFLRIRNVIERDQALQLQNELHGFVEMFGVNAKYENGRNGALNLFHHPMQWQIRQNVQIYKVFCELLGVTSLWVSIDRAKLVEPVSYTSHNPSFLHWDIDPTCPPVPLPIQGLVSLSDNNEGEGCFQCVPGYHVELQENRISPTRNYEEALIGLDAAKAVQIPLRAGDLLVWSSLLPHGVVENSSEKYRAIQYVRMYNSLDFDNHVLNRRLSMWYHQLPHGPTMWPKAQLSELGEYLVGLKRWPGR